MSACIAWAGKFSPSAPNVQLRTSFFPAPILFWARRPCRTTASTPSNQVARGRRDGARSKPRVRDRPAAPAAKGAKGASCAFVLKSSKHSNALSKYAWLWACGSARERSRSGQCAARRASTAPPTLRRLRCSGIVPERHSQTETRLRSNRLGEPLFSVVVFPQGSRTSSHSANSVQFVNFAVNGSPREILIDIQD